MISREPFYLGSDVALARALCIAMSRYRCINFKDIAFQYGLAVVSFMVMAVQSELFADELDVSLDLTKAELYSTRQSELDGKRLFFSAAERAAKNTSDGSASSTISADDGVVTGSELGVSKKNDVRQSKPKTLAVDAIKIRYQARILSGSALYLIVNGTPCQRVGRATQDVFQTALEIQCHGVDAGNIEFELLEDGVRLQVTSGIRKLGVLRPGEAL